MIICGNTLEVLKTLDSESIDCCITSPPYWSLRDYQTEPIIWDGKKDCVHEWGSKNVTLQHKEGETNPGKEAWYKDKGASSDKGNQFCPRCNAWKGSLGLEPTFKLYLEHLFQIFDEVKRVLKKTGTCFVNIGDTYGGINSRASNGNGGRAGFGNKREGTFKRGTGKSLIGIPERFAIGMTDRGWIRRNAIIWHKLNCMPQSCKDRFTVDFECVYFFTKSRKYYFEQQFEPLAISTLPRMSRGISKKNKWVNGADGQTPHGLSQPRPNVRKMHGTRYGGNGKGLHSHSGYYDYDGTPRFNPQGRNKRAVWAIPTAPFSGAHFAVFPEALVEPMIKAGCPKDGLVLDPFMGSGTVGVVAKKLGRNELGIELNPEYVAMAEKRINKVAVNEELLVMSKVS